MEYQVCRVAQTGSILSTPAHPAPLQHRWRPHCRACYNEYQRNDKEDRLADINQRLADIKSSVMSKKEGRGSRGTRRTSRCVVCWHRCTLHASLPLLTGGDQRAMLLLRI